MAIKENSETAMESEDKNELWIAAINKILQTDVPAKKSAVLALAPKEEEDVKPEIKKEYEFEIEGHSSDDDSQDEKPDLDEIDAKLKPGAKRLLKKEYMKVGHVKPDILEKNYEKTLMKVATKGVVQLFNAVKQQQKDIEKKVKSKKRKIVDLSDTIDEESKEKFLKKLPHSIPVTMPEPVKIKKEEEETWSVLRDDFLVSSSVKNWDK